MKIRTGKRHTIHFRKLHVESCPDCGYYTDETQYNGLYTFVTGEVLEELLGEEA